jgi:hypothetical protein
MPLIHAFFGQVLARLRWAAVIFAARAFPTMRANSVMVSEDLLASYHARKHANQLGWTKSVSPAD